jgi:hypothetical protein
MAFVFILISCPKTIIRFAFNSIPTTPITTSNIWSTMLEDPEAVSLLLDVDYNAEPHSTSMADSSSAAVENIETSSLLINIDHNKAPRYSESESVDVETASPHILLQLHLIPKNAPIELERFLLEFS